MQPELEHPQTRYRFFNDILPTYAVVSLVYLTAIVILTLRFLYGPAKFGGSNPTEFEQFIDAACMSLLVGMYALPIHVAIFFSYSRLPTWVRTLIAAVLYAAVLILVGFILCYSYRVTLGKVVSDFMVWIPSYNRRSWQFHDSIFQVAATFLRTLWGFPLALLAIIAPLWFMKQLFGLRLAKAGQAEHQPTANPRRWWLAAALGAVCLVLFFMIIFAAPNHDSINSVHLYELLFFSAISLAAVTIAVALGLWSLLRTKDIVFGVGVSTIPFFLFGVFFGAVAYETDNSIVPAIVIPVVVYGFAYGPLLALRLQGWRLVAGDSP